MPAFSNKHTGKQPPESGTGSVPGGQRLVGMGRVAGAFGVLGWIKVHPHTERSAALTRYRSWWLGRAGRFHEYAVVEAKPHGATVLAKLAGIEDREQAAQLRGLDVAVPRAALPRTRRDEYYWTDLIGLTVVNAEGVEFGTVASVLATGANDVLVVEGDRERLIPFIRQVVLAVDLDAGRIRVDWGVDY